MGMRLVCLPVHSVADSSALAAQVHGGAPLVRLAAGTDHNAQEPGRRATVVAAEHAFGVQVCVLRTRPPLTLSLRYLHDQLESHWTGRSIWALARRACLPAPLSLT